MESNREDTGLWFFDGKIITAETRAKIWNKWYQRRDEIHLRIRAAERQHEQKMRALRAEQQMVYDDQPCTPWVGRVDTGAMKEFVENAIALLLSKKGGL